jgi:hypothetical protein
VIGSPAQKLSPSASPVGGVTRAPSFRCAESSLNFPRIAAISSWKVSRSTLPTAKAPTRVATSRAALGRKKKYNCSKKARNIQLKNAIRLGGFGIGMRKVDDNKTETQKKKTKKRETYRSARTLPKPLSRHCAAIPAYLSCCSKCEFFCFINQRIWVPVLGNDMSERHPGGQIRFFVVIPRPPPLGKSKAKQIESNPIQSNQSPSNQSQSKPIKSKPSQSNQSQAEPTKAHKSDPRREATHAPISYPSMTPRPHPAFMPSASPAAAPAASAASAAAETAGFAGSSARSSGSPPSLLLHGTGTRRSAAAM